MALSRRELASRGTYWAKGIAARLARTGISANAVSCLSVVFAVLAAIAYFLSARGEAWTRELLIGAAIAIQLRLLCNLMDGMLAVEHGRRSPVGDLYNEVPDRLADIVIFLGAGIAAVGPWSSSLGVACAIAALFTAYVRLLGGALGVRQHFSGPMAKQHRMAALTFGTLIKALSPGLLFIADPLYWTLALIFFGTILTCLRRLSRVANQLRERAPE